MTSSLRHRSRAIDQPSHQSTSTDVASSLDDQDSPISHKSSTETPSRMLFPTTFSSISVMMTGALPVILNWGLVMGLIFGGCCSNVLALENIIKSEKDSGLLVTLVQFVAIACFTLPSHLDLRSSRILKKSAVPVIRWIPSIAMFFAVNILNNFAFGFSISVPVHIILRSGGSVTTMILGYIWGKRYNRGQVLGVSMLTVGVIIAALSDAQAQGRMEKRSSGSASSFLIGLLILFVAQLISAVMGLYTQLTYAKYGPHWHENLFYCHFLSLPLFLPILPSLWTQFQKLLLSPPLILHLPPQIYSRSPAANLDWKSPLNTVWNAKPSTTTTNFQFDIPIQLVNLAINALTQFACIRGVNLLATRTTALGVTIVLNLRKLVSLFVSMWLFGNELSFGVATGATIVFAGAAVYGWSGQQQQKLQPQQQQQQQKSQLHVKHNERSDMEKSKAG